MPYICPNCKTENPSLNILCSNCGQELVKPKVTTWSNVAKWLLFLFVIYFLGLVEELIIQYNGLRNVGMPNIVIAFFEALIFLIFPIIVFYLRDLHFKNKENNLLEKVYLVVLTLMIKSYML